MHLFDHFYIWFSLPRISSALLMLIFLVGISNTDVMQLDNQNIEHALNDHELVIVNFYADWCRFSQQLKPVFVDASEKLKGKSEVLFASVDCEKEAEISQKYHVSKYPTIKLFRFGEMIKKEYRGQRSMEAIAEHVGKQLETPVHIFASKEDLYANIDNSKRNVIAYFWGQQQRKDLLNFYKIASTLRDDCSFWLGAGDWVQTIQPHYNATLFFRAKESGPEHDFQYTASLDDYDFLKNWLTDKCVPLVREITFENAEELTEEGLPFLILFRRLGDTESERLFTDVVTRELADQKNAVNFLMADGKKFAHPLHHLGKSENDLPLIAIDSFRHMYLFPRFSQITEHDRLRQFVLDLHSGKLHREFHQGPDSTPANEPHHGQSDTPTPPPSVFKQLKPAENRYSLLDKTEL